MPSWRRSSGASLDAIEPELERYPAVNGDELRRKLDAAVAATGAPP